MKNPYLIVVLLFLVQYNVSAQEIIELPPTQSMLITGKGPGQDAAANPFTKDNSLGIVENIGKNDFTIRVQNKKGKIMESVTIKPGDTKEVRLLLGYELYLDSELEGKAKINYKKLNSY